MMALRPVIASNRVPYIEMTLVDSHCTSQTRQERRNETLVLLMFCCLLSKEPWIAAPHLLSEFLSNGQSRVSHQSHLSDNDNCDKMIPAAFNSFLVFIFGRRKSQLGDRLMMSMRPVITSNGVPYLQMTSVGSHCMSWREKERKDGPLMMTESMLYRADV